MKANRIVIIGAGQAGGWAARTLREEGFTGEIILIGKEAHAPYERPPLSKEFLLGELGAENLSVVSNDELADLGIKTIFEVEVDAIDKSLKKIFFKDNVDAISYDLLIICTGGRPKILPATLLQREDYYTLRTIEDSLRLRTEVLDNPSNTVIIGGGWIGLELAAAARQKGNKVTVIEAYKRLCARSVPDDISKILLGLHKAQGVDIRLSSQIQSVEKKGTKLFDIHLSNGEVLPANNIIVAIGLASNDDLAMQAGLYCDNGIVVDEFCKSSDEYIFAAGDVANNKTFNNSRMRLESWQNAQDQGIAVAKSILHGESYQPIPRVWSQQYDKFIQILGYFNDSTRVVRGTKTGGLLNFYLDSENTVCGVIGENAGRDWRFASKIVERSVRVPALQLADESKSLKDLI